MEMGVRLMGKCESSACRPPAAARGLRQRDRCPRPVRGSAALQQLAWRGRASEGWADQGDRSYIKSPFSNSRASGRRHAARVSGSGSSAAFDSVRRTIAATLNVGPLPATVARYSERGPENTRSALFTGTSRAGATGLEPATSGVTGRRSNQLSYAPGGGFTVSQAISARGRLGAGGRAASTFVDGWRNFRLAGEFETQNRSPEDAPNPAVGALLGSATGTLRGPRRA